MPPRKRKAAAAQPQKDIHIQASATVGQAEGSHVTGAVVNAPNAQEVQIHLPPATPALHQLRAPVGDFVGRAAEIAQLVQAMRSGAVAAISGVQGMGGIGKTELAYKVVHQLMSDFPDAQIVVELRGATDPLTPVQALQTVIRAFEPERRLPDDLAELQALYRSLLSGKRALILADNAHDAAQVRPLLPPTGCALLVTSRQRFTLPGMHAIDLGMLAPTEAEALLLAICSRIGEVAPALAKLCGYLPLALRVSAGLLASDATLPIAHYLERLADERTRLAALRDPDDPALDVEAVLALSYAALSPAAQATLCQLSIFVTDFDRAAAQAVIMLEGKQPAGLLTRLLQRVFARRHTSASIESLLGELYRRSLLDYEAALERYSLHDLVRVFAHAHLDAGTSEAFLLRYARHYLQVARQAERLYLAGDESTLTGLELFDRERVHIDAGWAWTCGQQVGTVIDNLLIDYAGATVYISALRYNPRREQIPQLEVALAAAQRRRRHADQGWLLGNLGLAYADLGEVRRAIDYFEQVLVIMRGMYDRRGESRSLNNLGSAYRDLGEVRRAIGYYEQVLVITRDMGDRRGEAQALGNLGNAYFILGEVRQAFDYHEQDLAITREVGDRQGESTALGNLGNAYAALGEVRQAIELYEQGLAIAREVGDRRGEHNMLNGLGNAYAALGEMRWAISSYEQSLEITCEVNDRRGEGLTLGNLGSAYADLGEVRRAIDCYEQSLVITRAVGDRAGEGRALGNLGIAYKNLGEVRRAIDYYEQQLIITRDIGDRRGEANGSWNLGLLQEQQGDLAQAIALMQVRVDYERAIGHTDAETHAARVEELRRQLEAGDNAPAEGDAPDEGPPAA